MSIPNSRIIGIEKIIKKELNAVIDTESATRPFKRKVIKFEDVPPGQAVINTIPNLKTGSIGAKYATKKPKVGIINSWPKSPYRIPLGWMNTRLKLAGRRFNPIPNIMIPIVKGSK